ncbi:MAG: hypothetical protein V2I33_17715 [Kangiellaceae bacterium]|jgi:hypothetical protein|nr:hypothetical protein [Kangiellaceae bacterium]
MDIINSLQEKLHKLQEEIIQKKPVQSMNEVVPNLNLPKSACNVDTLGELPEPKVAHHPNTSSKVPQQTSTKEVRAQSEVVMSNAMSKTELLRGVRKQKTQHRQEIRSVSIILIIQSIRII